MYMLYREYEHRASACQPLKGRFITRTALTVGGDNDKCQDARDDSSPQTQTIC